jgi:hypothetical protein
MHGQKNIKLCTYELPANVHLRREHVFMSSNADQSIIILYTFPPFINLSIALGASLQRLKHFQGWYLKVVCIIHGFVNLGRWFQKLCIVGKSEMKHIYRHNRNKFTNHNIVEKTQIQKAEKMEQIDSKAVDGFSES